jgi:hypothetical protein
VRDAIDRQIDDVCRQRFGATDVSVLRIADRPSVFRGVPTEVREWNGDWFTLALAIDGERLVVARRRSKAELLTFASTVAPSNIRGFNFGRSGSFSMPFEGNSYL